jgi:hypothetical protein
MKYFALLAAPSLGLLASVPVACISNANQPGQTDNDAGQFSEDSGSVAPPGQDATLPTADAGDAGTTPTPDGNVEAAVDAGPLPITVTVVLPSGAPESGIVVAFQSAAGAVVTTATTGLTGTVVELVAAGSQVTAALGTAASPSLVTIQDVAPGDALTIVDNSGSSMPSSEIVNITLPPETWDAASTGVELHSGDQCEDPGGDPIYLEPSCESLGEFPILAIATGAVGEYAYTYKKGNVAVPDAGLEDGGVLAVTVTQPWASSAVTQTISAVNAPPAPDAGGVANQQVNFYYEEVAGGVPYSESPATTADDGGVQNAGFVAHTGYPDFVQVEAFDSISALGGSAFSFVAAATRTAPPATSENATLDLSKLPFFTSSAVDTTDGGTPEQPTVTWTSAGSFAASDGIVTAMQWYAAPTDGGEAYTYGSWTILAPPTATSVQAPALPSQLAAWAPAANAGYYSPPSVAAVQASFLTGYPQLRAQFGSLPLFNTNGNLLSLPPLPVNGTLYVSVIKQNDD